MVEITRRFIGDREVTLDELRATVFDRPITAALIREVDERVNGISPLSENKSAGRLEFQS